MSSLLSRSTLTRTSSETLRMVVGTRGSQLARTQTQQVIAAIARACPRQAMREAVIATSGDRVQDRLLAEIGGKGLFAKELHEALLDKRIDLAVHSLKDLETELPPGIVIACMLPRADPRDALILAPHVVPSRDPIPYPMLPRGALVGTASARREAQLLHARPDLRIGLIRGNVGTRLGRLESGCFDATLLAAAGLDRLGIAARADFVLEPEDMLPAAGQGIVAVTTRASDHRLRALLAPLDDPRSHASGVAERAVLGALDGTCRTPIGAYARALPDGDILLTGLIARMDGGMVVRRSVRGAAHDGERLGAALGAALRAASPPDILS